MSRHQPYDKVSRPRRTKKRTAARSVKAPIELPVVNERPSALPYPISSAVPRAADEGASKPPERVATPPASRTNMSVEGGVKRTKDTEKQGEESPAQEREPWYCDFPGCDSEIKCSSIYNIDRHKRTHKEVKDYFCTWPECDYSTAQKENRDAHLLLSPSTGEKHRCGVEVGGVPCDREFTDPSQLSRHRQAEHDWPTREEKRLLKMGLDPAVEAVSPATIKALKARARKKERTSSTNASSALPTTSAVNLPTAVYVQPVS
ncbi:hypothetical protein NM688_g3905 [Phlebia brevispora]|uniref:Uncharacterized protein n=1 Tax=Phlebia brevispora TaxID=194682 RepID=A0ACC1T4K2_9APHY|nr:hypothetical protein NM688_g3905 [Phlebia brevispora]